MSSTSPAQPLRYDPSFEKLEQDEAHAIQDVKDALLKIASITSQDTGRGMRAVHAKSLAILKGELEVVPDLPAEFAQGLFAAGGHYPVVMRFSTSPGDVLHDKVSTPRGLAIKVFGVAGERLPQAKDAPEQDFLMVNGPAFLTPEIRSFARSLKLLASTTDKAEQAKMALAAALRGLETLVEAVGGESALLKSLGGHPLTHPLGETYFTQVPFLHGPYFAKYSLAPLPDGLRALKNAAVDLDGKPDGLHEAMNDFFAQGSGEWALRAQLGTSLAATPIEDPTVVWTEEASPYVTVGRIVVPSQPAMTGEQLVQAEDALFFDPWNGLAVHRPLGAINRARRVAYGASAGRRVEVNGVACPLGSNG